MHISFEKLADYVEDRLDPTEREQLSAHVSSCVDCEDELLRLSHVVKLMRNDRGEDAPADLIAKAKSLLSTQTRTSILELIVATLTFDTDIQTPSFAVRGAQSQERQLLFSADDVDVDLRVATLEDGVQITGQLLGAHSNSGTVELEGQSESQSAPLNDLHEFTLPAVPSGNYTLRLRLSDREIEIPDLHF